MVELTVPVVDVLDIRVRLVVPPDLQPALVALLDDLLSSRSGAVDTELELEQRPDASYRLVEDGDVVRAHVELRHGLATVVWRLNTIAARSPRHLVLHAGCVGAPGGAVLIPGESGAGKSTLTAALVDTGWSYLSDEHAALDVTSGLLAPVPKPLDLGGDDLVPAARIRPHAVGAACPPAAVAFPRFRLGDPLTLRSLEPTAALLALCTHTANLALHGSLGFMWLAAIAAACPAWQIGYGATSDAVNTLRDEVPDVPALGAIPAPPTLPVADGTTTVCFGDDAVVLDERTGAVHHLNPSAAYVWLSVPEAEDAASLAAAVLGDLPDTVEPGEVTSTIDHLAHLGLLPYR